MRPAPWIRALAERLIAEESDVTKTSELEVPGTFPGCERLRPHLATLMGSAGFTALLSRALALAKEEVEWLQSARVRPDGSLEEWEDLEAKVPPADFVEGKVVLLAQLLGLLEVFIGESLTRQITAELWPNQRVDKGRV